MPVVFSPEEAVAVLGELAGVRWLMGMQLYGGGLRLVEFSDAPKEHTDLVRDEIGMGPYDRAYKRHVEAGYRPAR